MCPNDPGIFGAIGLVAGTAGAVAKVVRAVLLCCILRRFSITSFGS